jgi:hypothetical protein
MAATGTSRWSGHNDRDFMWEDMLNYKVQGNLSLVDLGLKSAA